MAGLMRRMRRAESFSWDRDFIHLHLDERSRFLFYQMAPIDQRHALAVAKTVLAERGYPSVSPAGPLVQAALLHDIGKVAGDLTSCARFAVGIIKRIAPLMRLRWADRNGSTFARACYVDLHHAARGAYMAKTFGVQDEIASIIRAHHDPPAAGDSKVLTCLRAADNERLTARWWP